MMEKTCRCGKTKKNFKVDIGPFFIAECCTESGYNHLGERFEPEDLGLKTEDVEKALETAGSLQVVDDPSLDAADPEEVQEARQVTDPEELKKLEDMEIVKVTEVSQTFDGTVLSEKDVTEEAKADQKKKRQYNRNGQIKKET